MNADHDPVAGRILGRLSQLRFKSLFLIAAALLLLDLAIPDVIPLIDELILGVLTLLFWSWRKPQSQGVGLAERHEG